MGAHDAYNYASLVGKGLRNANFGHLQNNKFPAKFPLYSIHAHS